MEGYDVLTSDDDKVGRVVGRRGAVPVVETGHLLKRSTRSRRRSPTRTRRSASSGSRSRGTSSHDSPKVSDDDFDEAEVASTTASQRATRRRRPSRPPASSSPTIPAISAEQEGARHGIEPAEQRRAEIRENREATRCRRAAEPGARVAQPVGRSRPRP